MSRKTTQVTFLAAIIAMSLGMAAMAATPTPFAVTTSSFRDGGVIPIKFGADDPARTCTPKVTTICACPGKNVSPELSWSDAPAETKSYAILMYDIDGRYGLGVSHFLVYDIPAGIHGFAEGELSSPSKNFVGGTGTRGGHLYIGPCPPIDVGPHHYLITVIALDLAPDSLKPELTREDFMTAATGHMVASASVGGTFVRP